GEGLAAVLALDQREIGLEQAIGIGRIDNEIGEVRRPPYHRLAVVAAIPGLAAVVGTVQRALHALYRRVDDAGVRWRDGDRYAAVGCVRHSAARDFGASLA